MHVSSIFPVKHFEIRLDNPISKKNFRFLFNFFNSINNAKHYLLSFLLKELKSPFKTT